MKDFWYKLGVALTGYDSRNAHRELDGLKEAFAALPEPKEYVGRKP